MVMRKISLLLVSLLCVGVLNAGAQGIIIKGGYNYSNVDINKSTTVSDIKKGKSGWQIGVGYQSESSHGFSIQPEIVYKVSGYKFSDVQNLNLGYVEVPVNVQWGPDLLIARPFIFAGPYVGQKVSRGDCIALSGKSGRVTGPHLHYEVLYRQDYVNPAAYMDLDISPEDYDSMVRKPVGR